MSENDEIDFDSPAFMEAVATAKAAPAEQQQQQIQTNDVVETPDKPDNVETPAKPVAATTTVTEPNYAEYLATKSGGLFKNEEDFIAALEKVKNYDSVETRLKDTESKIPKFKNEEAEKWFNLVQSEDGTKAIEDYIAEKKMPYATMSSIDIMRSALKWENPAWDEKRVELELRHKYGTNLEKMDISGLDTEEDKEELKEANAHNREVDKNLELLEMHAYDKRVALIEKQKLIALPELKKAESLNKTPQLTPEEVADAVAKWKKGVDEDLPKLSNIKIDIDDKGVEYVSTDEDKAALKAELSDFNILKFFGESQGWQNPDKSWNRLKIAEDVRWLKEKEKVIKSIAGQVKTETIRATMAKIKGIDPNYQSNEGPKVFNTLEEAARDAIERSKAAKRNVEWEEAD